MGYTPEMLDLIKKVEASRPERLERSKKGLDFHALRYQQDITEVSGAPPPGSSESDGGNSGDIQKRMIHE